MDKIVAKSFTLNELDEVAEQLLASHPDKKLFAFYGSMGVGKTTLIKAICRQLNVKDNVGSPTFSIVNQYLTNSGELIHHFDFYRLKKIEEVYDIGYEDYFFGGDYCFLEWPDKVEELIPDQCIRIYLEEEGSKRTIRYQKGVFMHS